MLKKIMSRSLLIVSLSCVTYSMDTIVDFTKSPQMKELESVVGNLVSNPEVQSEAKDIFNTITHATTSTTTTSSTVPMTSSNPVPTIVINSSESPKKNAVPNLNLSSSLAPSRAMSTSIPKTPINNAKQLSHHVANAKRAQTARSTRENNGSSQDAVINMTTVPKRSVSPSLFSVQDNDVIDSLAAAEKKYLPSEVWDFVAKANPVLHKFAQEHNLSLDDFLMFAELKNSLDVSPQAVVDHIKDSKLPDDKKIANWDQPKKYEKIKKDNPDKYEEIILEMMKDLFDKEDGASKPSPLADTHIELAEDHITTQTSTIKKQCIGLVTTVLVGVGMFAGAVIWGAFKTAEASTGAPTFAPTYAPTFAPV